MNRHKTLDHLLDIMEPWQKNYKCLRSLKGKQVDPNFVWDDLKEVQKLRNLKKEEQRNLSEEVQVEYKRHASCGPRQVTIPEVKGFKAKPPKPKEGAQPEETEEQKRQKRMN